jgi:hypothetical protein
MEALIPRKSGQMPAPRKYPARVAVPKVRFFCTITTSRRIWVVPFAADSDVTPSQCAAVHGIFMLQTTWMVHAWVVPGWESPLGVFSHNNPERNRRLYDAIDHWAFCALTTSPGSRAFYDQRRAAGDLHHQALRALGNRLVGILQHHTIYDENTAWAHRRTEPNERAA